MQFKTFFTTIVAKNKQTNKNQEQFLSIVTEPMLSFVAVTILSFPKADLQMGLMLMQFYKNNDNFILQSII